MSEQPEMQEGDEPIKNEEQEKLAEEESKAEVGEEPAETTVAAEPQEAEAEKPADEVNVGAENSTAEVPSIVEEKADVEQAPVDENAAQDPSAEQAESPAAEQAEVEATESEVVPTEGGDAEVKEEKAAEEVAAQEGAPEEASEQSKQPPIMEIQVATPAPGEEEEVILEVQTTPHDDAPPLQIESEFPEPGTPERVESELDEEELMVEEEGPQYNREELVLQYQAAMQEREQLTQQNRALQHKLSEYFRKKKTEESRQELEKNAADQEQRYMKYMCNLEELREQQAAENESYQEQLAEMKERRAEKQEKVEEEWNKAVEFKRNVALSAINSRTGRSIPPKDIEMYEMNERKKESEVSLVRLEYIKLKNRLKKQELQLKQKEELAEGLHLIDFEQLKIENQTYNEKIEERNEELLKLRKKITNTVQVLTHLKEKLQFVQAENTVKKEQLGVVEKEVAQKRDVLSRTKQARDRLRHENNKFQQKCGLLGNTDLLKDFEVSTDEATDLEHRLDLLKRTHAELTLSLNGIKKKIELARDNQS